MSLSGPVFGSLDGNRRPHTSALVCGELPLQAHHEVPNPRSVRRATAPHTKNEEWSKGSPDACGQRLHQDGQTSTPVEEGTDDTPGKLPPATLDDGQSGRTTREAVARAGIAPSDRRTGGLCPARRCAALGRTVGRYRLPVGPAYLVVPTSHEAMGAIDASYRYGEPDGQDDAVEAASRTRARRRRCSPRGSRRSATRSGSAAGAPSRRQRRGHRAVRRHSPLWCHTRARTGADTLDRRSA